MDCKKHKGLYLHDEVFGNFIHAWSEFAIFAQRLVYGAGTVCFWQNFIKHVLKQFAQHMDPQADVFNKSGDLRNFFISILVSFRNCLSECTVHCYKACWTIKLIILPFLKVYCCKSPPACYVRPEQKVFWWRSAAAKLTRNSGPLLWEKTPSSCI